MWKSNIFKIQNFRKQLVRNRKAPWETDFFKICMARLNQFIESVCKFCFLDRCKSGFAPMKKAVIFMYVPWKATNFPIKTSFRFWILGQKKSALSSLLQNIF